MELLNLFVRITARDEASDTIDEVSEGLVGRLVGAAKKAAKALAGLWAVKKVVDFGKAAFDGYKEFEQLWGGVQKLYGNSGMELQEYADSVGKAVDEVADEYQRNERAQALMLENAQQAWRTAGMDANSYMETATSFSASLINSLEGDTEKAAQQTDVAMRAISDNYNTFGGDMQNITNAYQGFAKGNFTMLDNLRLGYGGTQKEMKRLIDDANEWGKANGKASDLTIDSFSDIVTAIEQIQEKQGIAGTTSREALGTIEGSMNATKSAWQNLVTEIGKPDADIGARISDMVTAIMGEGGEGGLLRNVVNEVKTVASNIGRGVATLFAQGLDMIVANGPGMVSKAMGSITQLLLDGFDALTGTLTTNPLEKLLGDSSEIGERVSKFVSEMSKAFGEEWPKLTAAAGMLWSQFVGVVDLYGPQLMSKVGEVLGNVGSFILEHGPEIVGSVADTVMGIVDFVVGQAPTVAQKFGEMILQAKDWIVKNGPAILSAIGRVVSNIGAAIAKHAPSILSSIGKVLSMVGSAILKNGPEIVGRVAEVGLSIIENIYSHGPEIVSKVAEIVNNVITAARDWIVANGPSILEAAVQTATNVINAVREHLPQILTNIAETLGRIYGYILEYAPKMISAGVEFVGGLVTGSSDEGKKLREWFSKLPDRLLKALGDVGGFLVDTGKKLIDGLLKGIGDVAPKVEEKIREAFQAVLDFFGGIGEFIKDPVGSIKSGAAEMLASFGEAEAGTASSMEGVEKSVQKSTDNAVRSIGKLNRTPLNSKKATAKVDGNAIDGSAKGKVGDTKAAIDNLQSKTVYAKVEGNALMDATKTALDRVRASIDNLRDKTVNVTTNQTTVVSTKKGSGGAWGGIRPHATGGIRIADRWGEGEPLDVVGERGPEAIVPLTSRYGKDFAQMMGREAAKVMGDRPSVTIYLTYNAGEDATQLVHDIARGLDLVM